MSATHEPAVLAIDGGGTGSRLAVATASDRVVVEAGPANVFTGFDQACTALEDGLARLARAAGRPVADIRALPACVALAGVLDDKIAGRVRRALGLGRARVEDDRRAAVEGALAERTGAVAALGTGSFFALKTGTRIALAGGWGGRVDDRASGYWIGREALCAALEAADGVGPSSELTDLIRARFGTPVAVAEFAARSGPADVAALARDVGETAGRGDVVARDILARAAAHVLSTLTALGASPDAPLCLTGGAAGAVATGLPPEARRRMIAPAGSGLDGAVARARCLRDGGLS